MRHARSRYNERRKNQSRPSAQSDSRPAGFSNTIPGGKSLTAYAPHFFDFFVSTASAFLTLSGHDVLAQDEESTGADPGCHLGYRTVRFVRGEHVAGYSIDLSGALAQETGSEYEYKIVETVQEQLEAVAVNEAELAIAAITIIEERENSSASIRTRSSSQWQHIYHGSHFLLAS